MLKNRSQSVIYDDAIFVASCLNEAIGDEICWPIKQDRRALATHIPQLPSCIGQAMLMGP